MVFIKNYNQSKVNLKLGAGSQPHFFAPLHSAKKLFIATFKLENMNNMAQLSPETAKIKSIILQVHLLLLMLCLSGAH